MFQLRTDTDHPQRNLLRLIQRDPILCAGPDRDTATEQATLVRALGGRAYVPEGDFQPEDAQWTDGFSAILWWGDAETARKFSIALAKMGIVQCRASICSIFV